MPIFSLKGHFGSAIIPLVPRKDPNDHGLRRERFALASRCRGAIVRSMAHPSNFSFSFKTTSATATNGGFIFTVLLCRDSSFDGGNVCIPPGRRF